eukprot:4269704-Amphidinium_carterae.1
MRRMSSMRSRHRLCRTIEEGGQKYQVEQRGIQTHIMHTMKAMGKTHRKQDRKLAETMQPMLKQLNLMTGTFLVWLETEAIRSKVCFKWRSITRDFSTMAQMVSNDPCGEIESLAAAFLFGLHEFRILWSGKRKELSKK